MSLSRGYASVAGFGHLAGFGGWRGSGEAIGRACGLGFISLGIMSACSSVIFNCIPYLEVKTLAVYWAV
jgi:hypothetical protein